MYKLCLFSFLLGIYPGVELLDQMAAVVELFEELLNFSTAAASLGIPHSRAEGSDFPTCSPALVRACVFDPGPLGMRGGTPVSVFSVHHPDDWGCGASMCVCVYFHELTLPSPVS